MSTFKIFVDGELFYHPSISSLAITQAEVTEDASSIDSLKLSAPRDHPYINNIKPISSLITLKKDDRVVFQGRALDDGTDFYNTHTWTCESCLAWLKDTYQPPFAYEGPLKTMLQTFLDEHNKTVEDKKKFTLGNVTVEDDNDYVHYASSSYISTMDAIKEKLIETHGGYLVYRIEDGVNYLDYLADFTEATAQTVEYGKNLLDVTITQDHSSRVTALIPYGVVTKKATTVGEADTRLDITSVNDGSNYVYDQEAVDEIGWIWTTQTWDSVTVAQNLLTKAKARLAELKDGIVSMELSIVDESDAGVDINDIHAREYVDCISAPHGINGRYLVLSKTTDFLHPSNNKISIGAKGITLSKATAEMPKQGPQGIQGPQGEKGDTGATGPQGEKGAQGPKGETGATGAQGPKGETGAAGKDGTSITIKGTAITYQTSSSGTDIPTGTWNTAVPSVTAGEYLWTRTVVTYSDGTSTTSYSVARFGKDGAKGETGEQGPKGEIGATGAQGPKGEAGAAGKDGTSVTVKSSAITYQTSSSGTTIPTGTWNAAIPSVTAGEYLWTRTVVTYSDETSTTSYSVARFGKDGAKGETGAQGPKGETGATGAQGPKGETGASGKDGTSVTVKSSAITYQTSSSGTTIPTGTWNAAIPSVTAGEYLWTRTVVTYSDETSTTSYSVARFGKDGAKGATGAAGAAGKDTISIVISSSNGTLFRNTAIATTLTAAVYKGAEEITGTSLSSLGAISWYLNGATTAAATGSSYSIEAGTAGENAVVVCKLGTAARAEISLSIVKDIKTYIRYYQAVTAGDKTPDQPTTDPPASAWTDTEPAYDGTDKDLYYTDLTEYTDGSFSFSAVSQSSTAAAISDLSKTVAGNSADVNALQDTIRETSDAIDTKADEIKSYVDSTYVTADDLETAKTDLQTSITETESSIRLDFQQTTDTLDNKVDTNQSNLEEYIRFNDGTIELGKIGNAFTATLSNEELAFLQDGTAVAYVSDNSMKITDAEIDRKLSLGESAKGWFDFIPRSNGNLSVKWRDS